MFCCHVVKLRFVVFFVLLIVDEKSLPSFAQTTENIDALIASVFGLPNGTDITGTNDNNSDGLAGGTCDCVPMNKCQKYNNQSFTGEGLIDVRIGQCPNSLDICCDEKRNSFPVDPPPTVVYKRKGTCGKRNENGVGFRITIKDSEAQFGEFPWMVAVMVKKENGGQYNCGGSLIHPGVVLTAVHCVYAHRNKPEDLIIRAGEWDSQSEDELIPFQERTARAVIIHKDYQSGPAFNDIALVLLKENFDYAENVDVICLPPAGENVDGMKCVASGWGKNEFGEKGVYQNILKRVDLPMVSKDQCENVLRTTRLGPKFVLHDSFVCAGGVAGIDTCKGDGGGPLVCPIPGKADHHFQVGIVAWGIGCGNNIPAVYVNLPYFRNWIDEQFAAHNLDMSYKAD